MDIPYDEKAVDFCKDCGGTGEKTAALKKQEDGWICKKCNGDGWVSSDELPDLTYLEFMELILLIVGEAWRVDDDGYFPAAIGRIERLCTDHISRCKRQRPAG